MKTYYIFSNGDTIRIGQEIQCLRYAGFFYSFCFVMRSCYTLEVVDPCVSLFLYIIQISMKNNYKIPINNKVIFFLQL